MPEQIGIRYFLTYSCYRRIFLPYPNHFTMGIGRFLSISFKTKEDAINAFLYQGLHYLEVTPTVTDPVEMLVKITDFILYNAVIKQHWLIDNPDVSDDTPIDITVIDGISMDR